MGEENSVKEGQSMRNIFLIISEAFEGCIEIYGLDMIENQNLRASLQGKAISPMNACVQDNRAVRRRESMGDWNKLARFSVTAFRWLRHKRVTAI